MKRRRKFCRSGRSEVVRKSSAQIERETASKWAKRAIDCFCKYEETRDTKWLVRGEDYRHEAIEHGSMVGDHGKTAGRIQREIERAVHSMVYDATAAPRRRRRRRRS